MLETWEAERFEEVKTFGRTLPLVIECSRYFPDGKSEISEENNVSSIKHKCLMLVKGQNKEISTRGLFNEVCGNLVAREFGVTTPRPALINIGEDFVNALNISESTRHVELTPGIAAGCEYIPGIAPVTPAGIRNNEELADAQAIYGVDLLIQNPDRRIDKPNCSLYRGGIIAFDFELGFSFLLSLPSFIAEPWKVDIHGIANKHIFFGELRHRRSELDWSPFIKYLKLLTPELFSELFSSIPSEWNIHIKPVTIHLTSVRDHALQFEEALIRSLL